MKKIIALIIAVTFIITALNISAYATSEPSAMTVQEFYSAQSNTVDRWVNGDITYNEWYEQQNAISYSPDMGYFVSAVSAAFVEKAKQNDLINAKQDVYYTSISEYILGYKAETTVKNLFKKYNKQFPQFTKDFLREAYYKSILYYLKNQ